jgi:deazaflavin-dependent oxidoreductase (nitroreductase family)
MPTQRSLRHVDPMAPRGPLHRLNVSLASHRFATWLATTWIWSAVVWRLDPLLLRLTGGRLGTGLLLPTALLRTRGARTGEARSNAVIYFHDGQKVTIVASKAGRPGNPSWFYNARANPDVTLGGEHFHAEIVEDAAELSRLWALADRVFPAYATYRRTADFTGRTIPVLQLVPRSGARS